MSDIPKPLNERHRLELIEELGTLFRWCEEIVNNIKKIGGLKGQPTFDAEFNKYNDTVIKILNPLIPQFMVPSITRKWNEFVNYWNQRNLTLAELAITQGEDRDKGWESGLQQLTNKAISTIWDPLKDKTPPRTTPRQGWIDAVGKNCHLLKQWIDQLKFCIATKDLKTIARGRIYVDQAIEKLTEAIPLLMKKDNDPNIGLIKGVNDLVNLFKSEWSKVRDVDPQKLKVDSLIKCSTLANQLGALGDAFGP